MNSSHSFNLEKIDSTQIQWLIKKLTHKISLIEEKISITKYFNPEEREEYHAELDKLGSRLRNINCHFFLKVKIEEDSNYKDIQKSDEYIKYTNVLLNISSLIVQDILTQPSHSRMLICAERWTYLLKTRFQENDFITSSCIVYAFNNWAIMRSGIPLQISATAQDIQICLHPFFSKLALLYQLQHEFILSHAEVLPALIVYMNMSTNLNELSGMDTKSREKIPDKQKAYNLLYKTMQTRLESNIVNSQDEYFLSTLSLQINENLHDHLEKQVDTISSYIQDNENTLIDVMKLFSILDKHEFALKRLKILIDELSLIHIKTKNLLLLRAKLVNTLDDKAMNHTQKLQMIETLLTTATQNDIKQLNGKIIIATMNTIVTCEAELFPSKIPQICIIKSESANENNVIEIKHKRRKSFTGVIRKKPNSSNLRKKITSMLISDHNSENEMRESFEELILTDEESSKKNSSMDTSSGSTNMSPSISMEKVSKNEEKDDKIKIDSEIKPKNQGSVTEKSFKLDSQGFFNLISSRGSAEKTNEIEESKNKYTKK